MKSDESGVAIPQDSETFTCFCRSCESDVRLIAEQRGEWGSTERHTARLLLACSCTACLDAEPDSMPAHWSQDMDYEHPISAEAEP